jgi:septal ring factor EnvC (AmiA/AmiB activator)
MDGLSGAASVTAVVDISAKVASLCFQYSAAVKDAKADIERLLGKVTDIKNVLEKLQQLLNKHEKSQLSTTHNIVDSLEACQQQLQGLKDQLEPSRGRRAMQRFGVRALKWPFNSAQVEKMIISLEQYERTFSLALQIDQTQVIGFNSIIKV